MKKINYLIILCSLIIFSCNKDDNDSPRPKPVITGLEVGAGHHGKEDDHDHGSEKEHSTVHIGKDVHIEFNVTTEDVLDYYTIKLSKNDTSWTFEKTYTDIKGKKNAKPHFHFEPNYDKLTPGEGKFVLTVFNQNKEFSKVEKEVKFEKED